MNSEYMPVMTPVFWLTSDVITASRVTGGSGGGGGEVFVVLDENGYK